MMRLVVEIELRLVARCSATCRTLLSLKVSSLQWFVFVFLVFHIRLVLPSDLQSHNDSYYAIMMSFLKYSHVILSLVALAVSYTSWKCACKY